MLLSHSSPILSLMVEGHKGVNQIGIYAKSQHADCYQSARHSVESSCDVQGKAHASRARVDLVSSVPGICIPVLALEKTLDLKRMRPSLRVRVLWSGLKCMVQSWLQSVPENQGGRCAERVDYTTRLAEDSQGALGLSPA